MLKTSAVFLPIALGMILPCYGSNAANNMQTYELHARVTESADFFYFDISNQTNLPVPIGPMNYIGDVDVDVGIKSRDGSPVISSYPGPAVPSRVEMDFLQHPRMLGAWKSVGVVIEKKQLQRMYSLKNGCYSVEINYSYVSRLGTTNAASAPTIKYCVDARLKVPSGAR